MATDDDGVHTPSEQRELQERQHATAAEKDRGSKTATVLGGALVVLLLLGGAFYYFGNRPAGTDVATAPGAKQPESSTPAAPPRPSASADNPAVAPTAPQSESSSSSRSQQSNASPPAPVATPAEPPSAPPAPTAQSATNDTPAAPRAEPAPMRDQPAALPDQPAAGTKNEVILVVKRGPATIRSEPGKKGRVIGTAAKNAQLKEIGRSGRWVEVESDAGRGWISVGLLAPLAMESR